MHIAEICLFLFGAGLIGFFFYTMDRITGDIAPFELVFFLLGGVLCMGTAIALFAFL